MLLLENHYSMIYVSNSQIRHQNGKLLVRGEHSPCSFEIRTDYFIERFDQKSLPKPNKFILVDGEYLDFKISADFLSRQPVESEDDFLATMKKELRKVTRVEGKSHLFQMHSNTAKAGCPKGFSF